MKPSGRRRFLKGSAALALLSQGAGGAGLGVGAIRAASGQTLGSERSEVRPRDTRAYGEPSRFENPARTPIWDGTTPSETPLQDLTGIITPPGLHFHIGGLPLPAIDPRQHRLLIHGLVDRPLIFTVEELKRLPSVSRVHFIECAGNTAPQSGPRRRVSTPLPASEIGFARMKTPQQTHGRTACSEWTGVLLSLLLREAGVQKGASWVVAEGAEEGKHTDSIPLAKAMNDVLVAYGQNGEPLRPEQGYPLRVVTPGFEGNINVKWVRRIKVVDQPYMTKMESTSYPSLRPDGKGRWFQYEMPPKSVITFPSGAHRLPGRGFYEITGLAWSGYGAIRRVEVSTDGGRSWKDAQLQDPVHRIAHTRFRLAWNWDGEETVLQSRCTDELGQVQPSLAELAQVWGVPPDYFKTATNSVNHFNAIYPWKVTREGSVENALYS